ncbi:hypothetical protein GPJ56_002864 [Histomonas meleagridis]|uniref:uncharacterized protein n=1 Tax=Histomonas meleagridis TaxID=135588 RepID=UPI00355AA8B0|nr:hypothetical protein GPJ56_002864 [Histomonas meleagridis]KAH0800435.1 hypothetical protein GO595_006846 [Histomonas meleagridis]
MILQLPLPKDIKENLMKSGGETEILNSINRNCQSTPEALRLLAQLIKEGQNDFTALFPTVVHYANYGKRDTRVSAGICISEFIMYNCDLVYPSFVQVMEDTENDPSDLNAARAISNLLSLEDEEVAEELIKALYHLSFLFFERNQVHEFRETCDWFFIPEKVNVFIDSDNEYLSDIANLFILTSIRGIIPFEDE